MDRKLCLECYFDTVYEQIRAVMVMSALHRRGYMLIFGYSIKSIVFTGNLCNLFSSDTKTEAGLYQAAIGKPRCFNERVKAI